MPVDPKLMELLRCPACPERPPVREEEGSVVCVQCGRRYPVEDGIPRMIVDDEEQADEPQS